MTRASEQRECASDRAANRDAARANAGANRRAVPAIADAKNDARHVRTQTRSDAYRVLALEKGQARSNGGASYRELPVSCREASFYRGGQLSPTDQPPGRGRPSITAAPSDRQANETLLEPTPQRKRPGQRSRGAPLHREHSAPSYLCSQRKQPSRRPQRVGGSGPAP